MNTVTVPHQIIGKQGLKYAFAASDSFIAEVHPVYLPKR
jgi:hypothetical protein